MGRQVYLVIMVMGNTFLTAMTVPPLSLGSGQSDKSDDLE
jgi:hypothetical protein